MFTHLSLWMRHLTALIGREPAGADYVFPHISSNGIPQMDRQIDHNKVQDLINGFTGEAGLPKHYATHCFRRGGAQYRFMYAPVGECWSLTMVRWWGSWADGEQVGCAACVHFPQEPRD